MASRPPHRVLLHCPRPASDIVRGSPSQAYYVSMLVVVASGNRICHVSLTSYRSQIIIVQRQEFFDDPILNLSICPLAPLIVSRPKKQHYSPSPPTNLRSRTVNTDPARWTCKHMPRPLFFLFPSNCCCDDANQN